MKNDFFKFKKDSFFVETIKLVILALLIVLPIRYFIFQPFFVQGSSMYPNFEDKDYLIVDELTYRFREPGRGEVIIFKYPKDPSQLFIKRIVGLPGEIIEIKDGQVFVTKNSETELLDESYLPSDDQTLGNIKVILDENEYFVLGDNRMFSSDSRRWGSVPEDYIVGKAYLRAWPFDSITIFEY
jgi:signal peptidase I